MQVSLVGFRRGERDRRVSFFFYDPQYAAEGRRRLYMPANVPVGFARVVEGVAVVY